MVELCSSDDTGVGPAMASGNQVCSGNWPLLPMQAMKSATAAHSNTRLLASPDSAQAEMPRMLKPLSPRFSWVQELAPKKMTTVPTSSPTSPTRTVKNAFRAARLLASCSHQCPISMNEQRPMISQPRMSWTMFSASTITSIPAENSVNGGEEVGVPAVAADVLERVDLHQQRDEGDEEQQHHGQSVDVLADAELDAAALPPRPFAHDAGHERLGVALFGRHQAAAEADDGAQDAGGVLLLDRVRALHPLHRGADRQDQRRRHRGDADLRALHRQTLAEDDDDEEGDARDDRDQPRVLEEPPGRQREHAVSPSSCGGSAPTPRGRPSSWRSPVGG